MVPPLLLAPALSICASCLALSLAYKVLVAVPGFNFHPQRTRILLGSLGNIRASGVDFRCVIFNYNDQLGESAREGRDSPRGARRLWQLCEFLDYFYANYATYLKAFPPSLVQEAGFTHVLVLLDDVELKPSFRLREALDIMARNNLSVASPAIGQFPNETRDIPEE